MKNKENKVVINVSSNITIVNHDPNTTKHNQLKTLTLEISPNSKICVVINVSSNITIVNHDPKA